MNTKQDYDMVNLFSYYVDFMNKFLKPTEKHKTQEDFTNFLFLIEEDISRKLGLCPLNWFTVLRNYMINFAPLLFTVHLILMS